MIAVTQPLRLGDLIETGGREGVVEEIGLIYTFITLEDGSRLVVPNEKLASDTIRNASIQRHEAVAQVSVQIPLGLDLDRVVGGLEEMLAGEPGLEVYVSELSDRATLQVRTTAHDAKSAEEAERALRLRVHGQLARAGSPLMSPPSRRNAPEREAAALPARTPIRMRRRRRHRSRAQRRRRTKKMILTGFGGFAALLVVVGMTGAGIVFTNCDLSNLRPVAIGQNSFVYAADGSLLGSIQTAENRQVVTMDQISPWMPKAVVAIEDRRFYEHGGVDYVGIIRAAIADLRARKAVQGASTITQQLVRNLYIPNHERTIDRKLKEVCLARKLDASWSKEKILTAYMNQVFYGHNAYGVEAAAQTYFSKPALELTLPEAALLAGLPQAPSDYDPVYNGAAALTRRNEVLKAMLDNSDITQAQYAEAVATPIRLKLGKMYTSIKEPYFFSYVKDALVKQYGAETVRTGGLKVYTTIDPRLQRLARKAIKDTLYNSDDPASAVIAIDPRTGAIRAMTGVIPGRPNNQFNLAAQAKRQPGSTFKVFVLTSAIEQGMNPYTTYYTSAPFTYQPDPYSAPWQVHTYSNSYAGSISVANATLESDNTVYAQLILDTGVENVAEMA